MYDIVVIYDSSSRYHSKLTDVFENIDDIKRIEWESEDSQEFLDAQFGWKPKTLLVVEGDEVYVGGNATDHLTSRQGIPSIIPDITKSKTQPFSTILEKAVDFTDDSDEISGIFPLKDEARDVIDDINSGTTIDIN